jgi:3',5'-cyclic AMP phosphodiesterase CpdA
VTTSARAFREDHRVVAFDADVRRKSTYTPVRDTWRFFHGDPRPLADASSRMLRSATGFGGRARLASRASLSRRAARPRVGLTVRAALPRINDLGSAARVDVMRAKPLFTIGLFADAQYADREDHQRANEPGRVKRFRAAPDRVREAMGHFTRPEARETMACIVNLGDLIDGVNDDDVAAPVPTRTKETPIAMREANDRDLRFMTAAVDEVVRGAVPVAHCLGNHDLNVESRERALEILYGGETSLVSGAKTPTRELSYFSRKLPRGWRLVVLDTTELNPRWAPVGSEAQRRCEAFVEERNAGRGLESPDGTRPPGNDPAEDLPPPRASPQKCLDVYRTGLKPWGGGIGDAQMEWLRATLASAAENGERVIVASHVPLSRTAARPGMAAWNCDEVSALLEASPAVALCVAGHDHPGRYGRTLVPSAQLHSGYKTFGRVHYVTLEAMLEAPADGNAFAALEVYDHEVIVNAGGAARGFFGEKYAVVPTEVSTRNAKRDTKKQTDDTNETRRSRNPGEVGFASSASSASSSARKNYATDRRLRVSPRGRFTGVASFSERGPKSRDDGDGTSASIRVVGSNQQAVDLLDWINANADDEDADMT